MEELFSNVENKFDLIIDYIKQTDDYKNYNLMSKKLKENTEIMDLINQIKLIQRIIIKENNKTYEKEIDKILDKLNEYPLYIDFLTCQDKINNEIQNIRGIIQIYLDNITK